MRFVDDYLWFLTPSYWRKRWQGRNGKQLAIEDVLAETMDSDSDILDYLE